MSPAHWYSDCFAYVCHGSQILNGGGGKVSKLVKGFLIAAVVLAILAVAVPVNAAETAKGTCTAQVGSNTGSYDCNYVAKAYEMGAPLTLHLEYACSVPCRGLPAFGLSG